jgi:uncharacterized membrane protein YoaK (UPF0700 family)
MSTLANGSLTYESEKSRLRSLQYASLRQERLAVCIAMIAGFVDAYGIINYNTYVSFMSGNATKLGYLTGQGQTAAALPALIAILFFVGGIFAGTLLAHSAIPRPRRQAFMVVAASLALIFGFTQLGFLSGGVHIAVLSFAMGLSTTLMTRVGAQSINVTFVTGALCRLGMHLAMAVKRLPVPDSEGTWDTHMHRILVLVVIWGGFMAGALLSGASTPHVGAWVLFFPMLILVALAVFDRTEKSAA